MLRPTEAAASRAASQGMKEEHPAQARRSPRRLSPRRLRGETAGRLSKLQQLQMQDSSSRYLPGYEETGMPQVLPAPPPKPLLEPSEDSFVADETPSDVETGPCEVSLSRNQLPQQSSMQEFGKLAEESDAEYTL